MSDIRVGSEFISSVKTQVQLIELQWRQQEQRTEPQIQPILLDPGFSFSD
ncbi:MAG: hypothetical protein LBH33_04620 [Endomicrobium sp.]|nr:hypothetical protein [Endomicrobium sp.]